MTRSNDDERGVETSLDELRARAAERRADGTPFSVRDLVEELRIAAPTPPIEPVVPLAGLAESITRDAERAMDASQELHRERKRERDVARRNHEEEIAERAERAREREAAQEDRRQAQEDREQAAADRRRAAFNAAQERRGAEQDRRLAAADRATAKKRARWALVGVIAGIIGSTAAVTGLVITLNREPDPVIVPAPVVTVLPPAPASPAPLQPAAPAAPTR